MNSARPRSYLLGAAAFWLVAALLRWWAAPVFELLPADYALDTTYAAKARAHQTPSAPQEGFESIIRRHDQTQTSGENRSIIQGELHWLTPSGKVIFETLNLYGVDRRTRQNLPGYGNRDRAGLYLFPPHTEKKQYGFWDPNYAGPNVVMFDHAEQFHGLEVYVFNSQVDGIDETEGFQSLPDVPKKYHAFTYGHGRFWIEPVSGVVVYHEDSGLSYFVDTGTKQRVGEPIIQWSQHYTPETVEAQLQHATVMRRWMFALELWLPLACAVTGLLLLAAGVHARHGVSS